MDRRRIDPVERSIREGFDNLETKIRHMSDFVAIGILDSKNTAKDVKQLVEDVCYVSYQTSCHDSRIDDNEMNLKEIMGKVDRIQEDLQNLQNLLQLNQGSHVQENPGAVVQKMEEDSVTQPMGFPGKHKRFPSNLMFFCILSNQ